MPVFESLHDFCPLTCASCWLLLQSKEEAVSIRPGDQLQLSGPVRQVMWNGHGGQDGHLLSRVVLLTLAVDH